MRRTYRQNSEWNAERAGVGFRAVPRDNQDTPGQPTGGSARKVVRPTENLPRQVRLAAGSDATVLNRRSRRRFGTPRALSESPSLSSRANSKA